MKIIECPRDAMQGMDTFIPTETKVNYLNTLLRVGFDTLDFGSFVSPKAIPQLRDTAEVLTKLNLSETHTKLLAIVANVRGAQDAAQHSAIRYLGFPLSISETFQQRNTNKSIAEALNVVGEIQNICEQHNKEQVVYISMGFGNPYNDPYDVSVVGQFVDILKTLGVKIVSLADTIGVSTPENVSYLFTNLAKSFPDIELGAHLHSTPDTVYEKVEAAFKAGCNRFDGALKGYGGCPMATDKLTGNLPTEEIISYLSSQNAAPNLNNNALAEALQLASSIFPKH